jgi:hypothetical protein
LEEEKKDRYEKVEKYTQDQHQKLIDDKKKEQEVKNIFNFFHRSISKNKINN